ncbi:glycosyltransferase family 4 protein [Methylobacterium sp. E-005]|uniref:glycosyltransferase family 4 protein n=1 Tax=Methylobacterium sp. E-005 TaxID=2836549 RepID=UPI001FB9B270|nr:glycosyltransferase family 4 protein [Methylobacterium sp. E-005]MCJ2090375.1 glycosyltransferase family 4 protein [Methylobacterium sp. E-005]
MKILLVPAAYFPALGGTERTTRVIAESLARRGHSVAIAVADISSFAGYYDLASPRTGRPQRETLDGVDIYRIELYSRLVSQQAKLIRRFQTPPRSGELAMKVLKYVSRSGFKRRLGALVRWLKPDVILTLPHLQPHVKMAAEIALSERIYLGIFPHIHANDPSFPHRDLAKVCRSADLCIAITEQERRRLVEDYGVPLAKALYSGLGTVLPEAGEGGARGSTPTDVLFVGRKTATKGLAVLAEAVKGMARRGGFRVVLIGARAPDTEALEAAFRAELGEGQFVSEHDVSDDELDRWYRQSRLVVLPSRIESFGSVILEAWARGRPIVTLDLPIFREIVSAGIDGLLVPPDDAGALSKAISDLLDDEAEADRMGRAGREKVAQNYTWPSVVDRIEGCLLTGLDSRARAAGEGLSQGTTAQR